MLPQSSCEPRYGGFMVATDKQGILPGQPQVPQVRGGLLQALRRARCQASRGQPPTRRPLAQGVPAAEQVRQPAVTSQLARSREHRITGLAVLARHQLGLIAPDHHPVLVVLAHDPAVLAGQQLPLVERSR